jgi:hypothetical protein
MTEEIFIVVWLLGWAGVTIFTAFINGPYEDRTKPPAFVWPLFFGFAWPAFVVMALIVAFLTWIGSLNKERPQ